MIDNIKVIIAILIFAAFGMVIVEAIGGHTLGDEIGQHEKAAFG